MRKYSDKRKARLICILAIIALLFVAAACGNAEKQAPKANDSAPQQVSEQTDGADKQTTKAPEQTTKTPGETAKTPEQTTKTPEGTKGANEETPENTASDPEEETGGIDEIIRENNKVDAAFTYQGKTYGFRKNVKTYLVMGIDRNGEVFEAEDISYYNGQCDAIYLLVMDHDNEAYTVLQLDRDAMVDIDILGVFGDVVGSINAQLCLAHAYGDGAHISCRNVQNAISRWLKGVPIEGYASLRFDALPILADDVGGVPVEIEDDLTSIRSDLKKGATVVLEGDVALQFARARMSVSDGKNTSRMRRQRTFLTAFKEQLLWKFKKNSNIVNTIFNDVKPYMCTNLTVGAISNLVAKSAEYTSEGFVTIDGINEVRENAYGNRYMEFHPDEDSLYETIIDLFCTEVQ